MDEKRELLRHTVATLAYRGAKVVRDMPAGCTTFKANETSRTPIEILAHVGDLLDWALALAKGQEKWKDSVPRSWPAEVSRFFQGPIADALTHVGQIALLRRCAGAPVRGENYHLADIVAGRVGPWQSPARKEFD